MNLSQLVIATQKHIPKQSGISIEIEGKRVVVHSDILRMELYVKPENLQEAIDILDRLRKIHTGPIF